MTTILSQGNGVRIINSKTDKFKTSTISLHLNRSLCAAESTQNALLGLLVKRGFKSCPDTRRLFNRLDDLYGASLDSDIVKKGDCQLIKASVEFARESIVGEPLTMRAAELLKEAVYGQGDIKEEYISQEKENLKNYIRAIFNDKRSYAKQRLLSEMCEGEPHALCVYGELDAIDEIDSAKLYSAYESLIKSPVDIIVTGDADIEEVIKTFSDIKCSTVYPQTSMHTKKGQVRSITDLQRVNQSKLAIGYTTRITFQSPLYPALLLYTAIFGGTPYSKLFNNVREKLSLAYYVGSRADAHKGIMTVEAGIDSANYDVAVAEIKRQAALMCEGSITSEEMENAKNCLVDIISSREDSHRQIEDFLTDNLLSGAMRTNEELTLAVGAVTLEQVVSVARNVCEDTCYLLEGSGENAD